MVKREGKNRRLRKKGHNCRPVESGNFGKPVVERKLTYLACKVKS